jgi:hypothetical protein
MKARERGARKTQPTEVRANGVVERPTETEGWPTMLMLKDRGLSLLGKVKYW